MTIAHGKDLRLGLYFQTEQFSEFISTICTYVSKSTTVNKNGEFFCLAPSTASFMGALHMLTGSMLYFVPLPGSDMLPCDYMLETVVEPHQVDHYCCHHWNFSDGKLQTAYFLSFSIGACRKLITMV